MILNIDNPVCNTIIIFSIIMILLYTIKPNVIYDNEKREFRQFGMTEGKTLLPIYVISILLALILYVFFYYLSQKDIINNESFEQKISSLKNNQHSEKQNINNTNNTNNINNTNSTNNINDDSYKYYIQQLQLQNMQNQLNQLVVQQQISSTSLNNKINYSDAILPNSLNV